MSLKMKSNIAGLIPEGRANAVTRSYLRTMTGMSDREVRKEIEKLRNDGMLICNNSDGYGYYISNDLEELKKQYKSDTARALSILKRRKYLRNYLKERGVEV